MEPTQFDQARGYINASELIISDQERELLRYAPDYARLQAVMAFSRARELQQTGVLRNGIYYVVLVDLVGSTAFMAKFGNERGDTRIETFISTVIQTLTDASLKNVSIFIKEIGDAALLCFSHFPDILLWHSTLTAKLKQEGDAYRVRTCVHVGEVYLNGVNPLSLAISQLFKMEKAIGADAIGLTVTAFYAAWPSVVYPEFTFVPAGVVELPGYPDEVPLVTVDLEFLDKQDTLGPEREQAALETE